MIEVHEISKTFQSTRGNPVEAVRSATFDVVAGEVFGLLGPNGAGKTTLLRMLGTLIAPTSGHCVVNGQDTRNSTDSIRQDIGFLSGNTKLYGRLTAREVLRYFGQLHGMTEDAIAARSETIAAMLDMHEFMDRRCDALSTGQTQKVNIARVILHNPKVLILDEPTLGLDIMTSQSIVQFIHQAKAEGHAIIFSTHYMTEAEQLCDRIGLIYKGEIMALGTQAELNATTGKSNLHDTFLHFVESRDEVEV